MSSPNKSLYAEQRRKQNRLDQEKAVQKDVENVLGKYFLEQEFEKNKDLRSFYPVIYDFIKRKSSSLAWKKHAHEFFRNYIKNLNQHSNETLPLPSLTFEIKRDTPIFTMEWIDNGHLIDEVVDKLWDYWTLAQDSQAFSADEIIGNIIISAMLYGGLNQKASLDALLDYLKNPLKTKSLKDLNILFLEPISFSYGDLFVDEKTVRKSRNFIPDQITRLWLIHFNIRKINDVSLNIEDYLKILFDKINLPYDQKTYKLLRDYANFNWMQLPNVEIDPALSQCLIENIATCGLSETEFERFLQPKFKYRQDALSDVKTVKSSSIAKLSNCDDTQLALNNVIKIHKDLLKYIRTMQTDNYSLIIDYCIENFDKFNDYSARIVLWLISLYKPTREKIQPLAEIFKFTVSQFEKSFQENRPLADSSIYTYYTRIAEPWLTHSLQYLDNLDDSNTIINKIYHQIISNTRLADEAGQPEFKKSRSETHQMLKRFHTFQQKVFNAESFDLESIATQNRPRARIIGPSTYMALISKLDSNFANSYIDESHYKTLKVVYILAYRTGMRINEILGLRIRDIEGLTKLSIWIQPYGSKKQGNLHQLKTDSAQRILPIYCLLKPDEYKLFHGYVAEQRLFNQQNLYLFRNWNENIKLNKHTVTTPFTKILSELFDYHDYSFHSLRHTAANHLSVLLNCDYDPLVKNLTDYTESEYNYIRTELLQNKHGQNHWFIIAHLLGHIDPSETFKSYIHLSYLIAGYKISKYHIDINNGLAKKMMGYNSSLSFLKNAKNADPFDFGKHSSTLCQLLLNDQTNWPDSNLQEILNELSDINSEPHDFFKYFAGTKDSKVSFKLFFKCLNLLEIHHDPHRVSQELSLPTELVKYWYENAQNLSQLKSRKNNSRLFNVSSLNSLKPAMVDTTEEQQAIIHFFSNIQNLFEKNPDQIQAVLNVFLDRVTVTHTGIHYQRDKIDQLELFYAKVKNLFPNKLWHLLGKDLNILVNSHEHPLLFNLVKSNTEDHPTAKENYVRLQLYSIKNGKALAVFKFCLHLACIGRPRSLDLYMRHN